MVDGLAITRCALQSSEDCDVVKGSKDTNDEGEEVEEVVNL